MNMIDAMMKQKELFGKRRPSYCNLTITKVPRKYNEHLYKRNITVNVFNQLNIYSLRLLNQYLKKKNRIYLKTNSKQPDWLTLKIEFMKTQLQV